MITNREIVIAERMSTGNTLLGLFRAPQVPQPRSDTRLYACTHEADGSQNLQLIVQGSSYPELRSACGAMFYHVSVTPHPVILVLSKALTDPDACSWDCRIDGQLTVADCRRFLQECAIAYARPETPLSERLVESWVANALTPRVRDSVRGHTGDDLKTGNSLTKSWWQTQISGWLDEYGLAVRVSDVSWRSEEKEAADEDAARQKGLSRIAQARRDERDAELREAKAKAEYESSKLQIERDLSLLKQDKTHQLALLERRYRKELSVADLEVENGRRAAEKATLKHEVDLAHLRNDAESAKQAADRQRRTEEYHRMVLQELRNMRSAFEGLAQLPQNDWTMRQESGRHFGRPLCLRPAVQAVTVLPADRSPPTRTWWDSDPQRFEAEMECLGSLLVGCQAEDGMEWPGVRVVAGRFREYHPLAQIAAVLFPRDYPYEPPVIELRDADGRGCFWQVAKGWCSGYAGADILRLLLKQLQHRALPSPVDWRCGSSEA